MPRFFYDPDGPHFSLTGESAAHIARSLRMRAGELLTVCDGRGIDHHCKILFVTPDVVELEELECVPAESEPRVELTLFQGLPKGEKLEWVIQKAVELGVTRIVPVLMSRSISRPDERSASKKQMRWQKIALEAAKQSGRGRVPTVEPVTSFSNAVADLSAMDLGFFCYEQGGASLKKLQKDEAKTIGFLVGPEGGIAPEEADALQAAGLSAATLGPRILRTETAPLLTLSVLLYQTGNLE